MLGAGRGQGGNAGTKWIQGTDAEVTAAIQMEDDGIFSEGGNVKAERRGMT